MTRLAVISLLFVLSMAPALAAAAPEPPDAKQPDAKQDEAKSTAHFASLRSDKVNLRTGPSADYPIEWVFVRKGLPVEILAQFDTWRKIRDSDGTVGWVHQGMLSSRRSVLVTGGIRTLRADPKPDGEVVATLEPGVIGGVSRCNPQWCEVKVRGFRGWLQRGEIWGLEDQEIIQ